MPDQEKIVFSRAEEKNSQGTSRLRIAVIGGRETVMGFKALGLTTCPAANAQEAREALRHLTRDSEVYAIIYIEETLAAIGLGQSALKQAVERAVGTNILGD